MLVWLHKRGRDHLAGEGQGSAITNWDRMEDTLMTDVLGRPAGYIVKPEDRQPIITDWTGMNDWSNSPPSYEIWAEQYRSETEYWVRRAGVHPREVADVVAEIMTRAIERDTLGVFRRDWETRSASGKSNFRSYYSQMVFGYAKGKHRNAVRHSLRNYLLVDAPIDDDGTTWFDVKAPAHEDNLGRPEFEEAIAALRTRVSPDLVDAVLMLALDGPVKQGDLREVLGVNPRTAKQGLESVRAALRDVLADAG